MKHRLRDDSHTFKLWAAAFLLCFVTLPVFGRQKLYGFDVSNVTIPVKHIVSGGPGRDGIPSIDRPRFIAANRARFLRDDDTVLSMTVGGETRAYPFRILVWHEIVNDRIGETAFAVTYCPLCGTAMVFDRRVAGRTLEFGVSGLLYQSDMLMYDRQTESLWPQIGMAAVSGPLVDQKLTWMPSAQMTWAAWRERHPDGRVLSTDTGHRRDYARPPYEGYERTERLMFPVNVTRREFRNKEWVVGFRIGQMAVAVPLSALIQAGRLEGRVADVDVQIEYDKAADAVHARNKRNGEELAIVRAYWFAWQAFYPETLVWEGL